MGVTRANWHLDVPVDDGDPFQSIEAIGMPIDLRDPGALSERLAKTLTVEGALFNQGCVCPIKDHRDVHCSACGIKHHEPDDPLTALCVLGTEQEKLTTALVAARHGREL